VESERKGHAVNVGRVLITQNEIETRVRELASQISADYEGKDPILISLLKGGFVFLADLIRHISIPHEVDFIKVSSYRDGCSRSERIEIVDDLRSDVRDRDVIIIEGIVDTGHTVSLLERLLLDRRVGSMKVCALLDKPSSREIAVPVDYVGFTVPDCFVVGYGLDFNERFRNLSYIAELVPFRNPGVQGESMRDPAAKTERAGGGAAVPFAERAATGTNADDHENSSPG
jgi:hypoxanthine phosphoribosyltransferase